MSIIINPGSGPVRDATYENAAFNICVFANEVGAVVQEGGGKNRGDGRWTFTLQKDAGTAEVEMPGLPLARVRYIGEPDQNIWDFPRLYVDGSSWVWEFAVRVCFRDDGE